MINTKCIFCNKEFLIKPSFYKNGKGKFCSLNCKNSAKRNGLIVSCFICKKETYKTQKILNRSKSKKYFCSKSCQTIWRNSEFVGEKHANWKHGKQAYRTVLLRNRTITKCNLCGTEDKRVLAVHHIDKNRLNNKIENLAYLCHNCHHLVHHYKVEL